MNQTTKYGKGLLPTYFKLVGVAAIVLALVGMVVFRSVFVQFKDQKELIKAITLNIIILGFFLIAWSRDKVEDEMTVYLRFRAMGTAFLFAIFM